MASNTVLLLGLVAIFSAIVLALGAIAVFGEERRQVGRSLTAITQLRAMPESLRKEVDQPFAERVLVPAIQRLSRVGRRWAPGGQLDNLKSKLEYAGSPVGWDVDRVLAFKVLGLLAGALVGLLLGALLGAHAFPLLACILIAAAIGFMAPNIVLTNLGQRRRDAMRKTLPDSLDLLSISVEAGLAFDAALAQVARNTEGPLASELSRVLQEMQIGVGRSESLRGLGDRSNLPELRSFVTAMVQADAFGIPIANVLRVQSAEMRVKRRQFAEEKAQKVPVKILFPLILCILPSLFGVILGPAALQIIKGFNTG